MLTDKQVSTIAQHFIIACIWADCEEGTHPRETKAAVATAENIVREFYKANPRTVEAALACDDYGWIDGTRDACAQFGHDLYLSSQGHGTGFFDRDALPRGLRDRLQNACDQIDHRGASWTYDYEFYRGWLYLHQR